jgi:DNA replicative helicase MCM subunit Mcm2 (Cdc46/Mcm family)
MKTKVCQVCNAGFPQTIIMDGETVNLQRRKMCLNCSPFKQHNTKSSDSIAKGKKDPYKNTTEKECSKCGKVLPFTKEFYYQKLNGYLYPYCRKCNNKATMEYQRNMKQKCVEYGGGQCKICDYKKHIGSLEFHHINPSVKEFRISGNNKSWEEIKPELDKCVLVCSNCHKEIHGGLHPQYLVI